MWELLCAHTEAAEHPAVFTRPTLNTQMGTILAYWPSCALQKKKNQTSNTPSLS